MKTLSKFRTRGVLVPAALFGAIAATPAQAQDDDDWSGFYAGVQLGGAQERLRVQATDTVNQLTSIDPPGAQPITIVPATLLPLSGRQRDTSLTYGGHLGWQFQTGEVVLGLEGDLSTGRSSVDTISTVTLPQTLLAPPSAVTTERHGKSRYEWSARARIGIASGSTLFYATAGVAGVRVRLRYDSSYAIPAGNNAGNNVQAFPAQGPFVVSGSGSGSLLGWTAGLGIEQRLGAHVRIGIDGRYTDYGSKNIGIDNATRTSSGTPAPAPFTAVSDEGAYPGPTHVRLTATSLAVRATLAF